MKFTRRGGRLAKRSPQRTQRVTTLWTLCSLWLAVILAGAAALGCSKKEAKSEGAQSEQAEKDVGVKDFVDYATGKAPIEQGKRLKNQIRDITAERERQSEEALGE